MFVGGHYFYIRMKLFFLLKASVLFLILGEAEITGKPPDEFSRQAHGA